MRTRPLSPEVRCDTLGGAVALLPSAESGRDESRREGGQGAGMNSGVGVRTTSEAAGGSSGPRGVESSVIAEFPSITVTCQACDRLQR
jgi:hypothetical protein